jgi:hypothetical protein
MKKERKVRPLVRNCVNKGVCCGPPFRLHLPRGPASGIDG